MTITRRMRRSTFDRETFGSVEAFVAVMALMVLGSCLTASYAPAYPFVDKTTLTNANGTTGERFGAAVAISADGNTVAVGAPGNHEDGTDLDTVQIFVPAAGSTWNRQATLTHPNALVGNHFGSSLALSNNGDRLVVGSPRSYSAVTFARTGSTWAPVTQFTSPVSGSAFGHSVAINGSGTRILVGSPKHGTAGRANVLNFNSGTAQSGGGTILGLADSYNDRVFGASVSLTDSGSTAFIGAPGQNGVSSTLRPFSEGPTSWSDWDPWFFLDYDTPEAGSSLDLSGDDQAGIIGAPGTNSGKGTIIPMRNDGGWRLEKDSSPGPSGLSNGDRLGTSVAASNRGSVLLAGAPGKSSSRGAVLTYIREDINFFDSQWNPGVSYVSPDPQNGDLFGSAVAVSRDGSTSVIGAPGADRNSITDRGSAYIFEDTSYTLQTSTSGSGEIRSTPSGISCGSTCTGTFAQGQVVSMTARPAYGQQFNGWTGACSGTGSCQITMSSNKFVSASFGPIPTSIRVTKTGLGSGTVSSAPAGIDCGATCSSSFQFGAFVNLHASPIGDSTFEGWGGACASSGMDSSCLVIIENIESVTANFAANQRLISIDRTGGGVGTVTSSPKGLTCIAFCTGRFDFGSTITLTAQPGNDSKFAGWGGECQGSGRSCNLNMTTDKSISVQFSPDRVDPKPPSPPKNKTRVCGLLPGSGAYKYVRARGVTCRKAAKIGNRARRKFCKGRNGCRHVPPIPIAKTYRGVTRSAGWRCRVAVRYEASNVICRKGSKLAQRASGA